MMKKKGILLVNLGTPKSPQPRDVFRYLNEFLTDKRVINLPWLRRQCLVRGVIVPSRYKQSAKQYQSLWTKEGSPLLVHSQAVRQKLQESLGKEYTVSLAMRYQSPSILEGLQQLKQEEVDELVVLPLFPQYASATTGSVLQKVMQHLQTWEVIPRLIFINHFFSHPQFIEACCARAKQYFPLTDYDHILFSFHGLPEKHIRSANPRGRCFSDRCCQKINPENRHCYKAQCYATAHAIAHQLGLEEKRYSVCFQSRLGKEPWLQPYTTDLLHACSQKGDRRLLVFSPSFVCDCLETTYEIAEEYQREFQKQGGEKIQLVEGLNSHPLWIEALRRLVLETSKRE